MTDHLNLLFVCSRNQWRSPTAERVFRDDERFSVRSRGTSDRARRTLTASDLTWADAVFVMETRHRSQILQKHRDALGETPLHVLEIPDDYALMDPELVEMLVDGVGRHLA